MFFFLLLLIVWFLFLFLNDFKQFHLEWVTRVPHVLMPESDLLMNFNTNTFNICVVLLYPQPLYIHTHAGIHAYIQSNCFSISELDFHPNPLFYYRAKNPIWSVLMNSITSEFPSYFNSNGPFKMLVYFPSFLHSGITLTSQGTIFSGMEDK